MIHVVNIFNEVRNFNTKGVAKVQMYKLQRYTTNVLFGKSLFGTFATEEGPLGFFESESRGKLIH